MSTHNICFHGEIRKILYGYPLLSVAMVPSDKTYETCATSKDHPEHLHSLIRVRLLGEPSAASRLSKGR